MSKTLLDIVQRCLNDIDGDEVNSIEDTIESLQVANVVRDTYENLMTSREWPHNRKLITLTASGDSALPTHMTLPSRVQKIVLINYDARKTVSGRKEYKPVTYKYPDEFLRMLNNRNSDSSDVDIIQDPTGIELLILNDQPPSYYTSFDDNVLVFDSYNSNIENTLMSAKVQAMAYVLPTFTLSDTFIPDLPEEAFPLLIEEAKSRVSAKLRQTADPKSEQESRRQSIFMSRNNWAVKGGVRYPNYGRK